MSIPNIGENFFLAIAPAVFEKKKIIGTLQNLCISA